MKSIYRKPAIRAQVLARHAQALARSPIPVESRSVDSRFGDVHVLVAGPEDAAPLVLVHGAGGSSLATLFGFAHLAARHRCVFIDMPGQPNPSSETRPNKLDREHGACMQDLLDGLGLLRAAFLGISGGGFTVLDLAASAPERIERAVLVVPEGFSRQNPLVFAWRVGRHMLRHRLRPSLENARRFAQAMASPGDVIPDATAEIIDFNLRHLRGMSERAPSLFTRDQLAGLRAPVLLVSAGRDVIFPGGPAVARARAVLQNLVDVIFLPDANHSSAEVFGAEVQNRIAAFLDQQTPGQGQSSSSQ